VYDYVYEREKEKVCVCVYEQERNDFLIPTKAFWTKKKSLRWNKTVNHSIDIN